MNKDWPLTSRAWGVQGKQQAGSVKGAGAGGSTQERNVTVQRRGRSLEGLTCKLRLFHSEVKTPEKESVAS